MKGDEGGSGTVVQEEESDEVINCFDDGDIDIDIDISMLLFQEEEELFSDLFATSHAHAHADQLQSSSSDPDPESISLLFRDIEHKLLNDNEEDEDDFIIHKEDYLADEFFSDIQLPSTFLQPQSDIDSSQSQHQDISMDDLLVDVVPPPPLNTHDYSSSHSSPSHQLTMGAPAPVFILNDPDSTSTPESQVSFQDDNNDNLQNDHENENTAQIHQENTSFNVNQAKENTITTTDSAALEDKDDDDPITKKRKRQMRNRDAAVRSRERKKTYVKDLEVKSKYLEAECIRLQRLLQCCAAENNALHIQLQEKAFSASRTKQESAVLLLESLLLGSLLWFLGILGLFSPEMLRQLPADQLVNEEDQRVVDLVALGRAKSKSIGLGTLRLFFKSKRCKASRSKMKILICNGAVVA